MTTPLLTALSKFFGAFTGLEADQAPGMPRVRALNELYDAYQHAKKAAPPEPVAEVAADGLVTWREMPPAGTKLYTAAPAQSVPAGEPGLKRHALEAAYALSKYAAAPFFPDTDKRGVKRETSAEWWDGLATAIEESQPLLARALQECAAPAPSRAGPTDAEINLPDIEDLSHSIIETMFAEGIHREVILRFLRGYEKQVRAAMSATSDAKKENDNG